MRLLQAVKVLSAAFVMAVTPEASIAVAASGALTEEASVAHPAGLLVRLLQAVKAPLAVFVMVVTPGASMAVAASGALTGEVTEEAAMAVATGKLKDNVSEEGPMRSFFFCLIPAGILGSTHLSSRSKLVCLTNLTPP